jgi:hypothetical protein
MDTKFPAYFEIFLAEQLDACWWDAFAGLRVEWMPDGGTLISGELPDQAALFGVIFRIRDLNLSLVSLQRHF